MKWLLWFFVVNTISFVALMKSLETDYGIFIGAPIALLAWTIFIFKSTENGKRKNY